MNLKKLDIVPKAILTPDDKKVVKKASPCVTNKIERCNEICFNPREHYQISDAEISAIGLVPHIEEEIKKIQAKMLHNDLCTLEEFDEYIDDIPPATCDANIQVCMPPEELREYGPDEDELFLFSNHQAPVRYRNLYKPRYMDIPQDLPLYKNEMGIKILKQMFGDGWESIK